ncbi:hypothetical protein OB08_06200 [Microbacterium sp. HJ5]
MLGAERVEVFGADIAIDERPVRRLADHGDQVGLALRRAHRPIRLAVLVHVQQRRYLGHVLHGHDPLQPAGLDVERVH